MKNITQIIIGIMLVSFNYSNAQNDIASSVNQNSTESNSTFVDVRYYYYPNLQAYFDTKVGMYLTEQNGEWVESEELEPNFRGYSINNGKYVMIENYSGEEPFELLEQHKAQYPANFSSRPSREVASN